MSDPLHTLDDMDEYSGAMGSDADVAALASIVGEVEAAVVSVSYTHLTLPTIYSV